ncbi:hypothetical protein PAXINDRAFT_153424 [Paxillus involutus ATCC 200175]|nr:hypothetical protein PAXINDRAFT_153424 [Paxillus involutus ATCC 200175]
MYLLVDHVTPQCLAESYVHWDPAMILWFSNDRLIEFALTAIVDYTSQGWFAVQEYSETGGVARWAPDVLTDHYLALLITWISKSVPNMTSTEPTTQAAQLHYQNSSANVMLSADSEETETYLEWPRGCSTTKQIYANQAILVEAFTRMLSSEKPVLVYTDLVKCWGAALAKKKEIRDIENYEDDITVVLGPQLTEWYHNVYYCSEDNQMTLGRYMEAVSQVTLQPFNKVY